MKLIIGLGNPGKKYQNNRHNIGFMIVDNFGHKNGFKLNKLKFQSMWNDLHLHGQKIVLVKPLTYMNRSGHAVRLWKDYFDIESEDILVIHDDMDLSLGQLRMRPKGGAGGHNGLKSIINNLGDKQFPRLRFGVGRAPEGNNPAVYVLNDFSKEEFKIVKEKISDTEKGLELFCEDTASIFKEPVFYILSGVYP